MVEYQNRMSRDLDAVRGLLDRGHCCVLRSGTPRVIVNYNTMESIANVKEDHLGL